MSDTLTPKPEINTALDAFYHLYALEKHDYESELEYIERKMLREQFDSQLQSQGITKEDVLFKLQQLNLVVKKVGDNNDQKETQQASDDADKSDKTDS